MREGLAQCGVHAPVCIVRPSHFALTSCAFERLQSSRSELVAVVDRASLPKVDVVQLTLNRFRPLPANPPPPHSRPRNDRALDTRCSAPSPPGLYGTPPHPLGRDALEGGE